VESPSKKNTPKGMNPEAKKVWVHIIHRYSDLLFGSPEIETQWFRAKRMFEQACKSRDLEPYSNIYRISASLRKLCFSQ
jgi:hypothetical protein